MGGITALRPFLTAVCGPLWSALADRLQAHRTIFVGTFLVMTLLRASIGVVAQPFWYVLMIIVAIEVIGAPVTIISDTAIVSASEDDGDYGRCRLWACLAGGVCGSLAGPLIQTFGDTYAFLAYGLGSLLALAAAYSLDFSFVTHHVASQRAEFAHDVAVADGNECSPVFVPARIQHSGDQAQAAAPTDSVVQQRDGEHPGGQAAGAAALEDRATSAQSADALPYGVRLRQLLSSGEMITFLVQGLVMGICTGIIEGYLFMYLDDLGAPATLMGACLAGVCCVEMPVFANSGRILKALGYGRALHVVLGCFCLRLLAYSFLDLAPSLWLIVPVEMLHGLTFGLSWTAGLNYCNEAAPPGLKATLLGLFQSMYAGLGRGVGGLFGGIGYHQIGPSSMFKVAFLFVLTAWALISAAMRLAAGPTARGTSLGRDRSERDASKSM